MELCSSKHYKGSRDQRRWKVQQSRLQAWERELQPLLRVQSRVKVCCDVLSHQHRGLPASGKLITPVTASKPHPTCLAMPPLKCCYCFLAFRLGASFLLAFWALREGRKSSPTEGEGHCQPNPKLGCSRRSDKKHKPSLQNWPEFALPVSFCPSAVTRRTGFAPRGQGPKPLVMPVDLLCSACISAYWLISTLATINIFTFYQTVLAVICCLMSPLHSGVRLKGQWMVRSL